jgi:putative membrane protein
MAQSPAPRAQEFVNKVAVSDMFEIQSSQLALTEKQPDKDTKPFAQRMVKDHPGIAEQVEQNLLEPHGVRVERAHVP